MSDRRWYWDSSRTITEGAERFIDEYPGHPGSMLMMAMIAQIETLDAECVEMFDVRSVRLAEINELRRGFEKLTARAEALKERWGEFDERLAAIEGKTGLP